jgi:hypothetical protein
MSTGSAKLSVSKMGEEASKVSDAKMAEILNAIGQDIAAIVGGDANDSYLYAEAADGAVEAGVFQDVGDKVIYHDPNDNLFDDIQELWYMAEAGKNWEALHYDLNGGQFDARFEYPDVWDPEETSTDRRERALKERFGDKPVIYPPPDKDFHDLTEADLPDD